MTPLPTWTLRLPEGTKLLNSNQRLHFRDIAKLVAHIRQTTALLARHHRIPALQRIHVFYVVHPRPTVRRRDPGNWAPSAKAAVDGLVDAGVLPDDDHTRLLGPDPRLGTPVKHSQLALVITDLTAMPPEHLALLNPPVPAVP